MSLEARLQKHWSRRSRAPVQPPPSPSPDDVDSDEEVDIRDKWNSGPSGRPIDAKRRNAELASAASSAKPPPSSDPVVQSLKDAGTAALNEGKYDEATEHYTEALAMLRVLDEETTTDNRESGADTTVPVAENSGPSIAAARWALTASDEARAVAAALFSNRSLAHHRSGRYVDASVDGAAAAQLRPFWPKPYYRIAVARLDLGHYPRSVAACRRGEALAASCGESTEPFLTLLNTISYTAMRNGSFAGFDGRTLEVRSAGEDAWMGGRAPKDPFLDGVNDEDVYDVAGKHSNGSAMDAKDLPDLARAVVDPAARANYEAERARRDGLIRDASNVPRSFRCLLDAVKAARDGDRIVLLRGIHNTMGETCDVDKRILIRGEGRMDEVTVDARSNTPVLRITASCAVQNLFFDMTGFRETLYIEGGAHVRPMFEHVRVKCSGDDTLNIAGAVQPLFVDCYFQARKNGVRTLGTSRTEMIRCRMTQCNHSGLKVMDNSSVTMRQSFVTDNDEDGIVAMDEADVTLVETQVHDNRGPGVDVSGAGRVVCRDGSLIKGNIGGLWMWEEATAHCDGLKLNGGESHAMLVDGNARARVRRSVIEGIIQCTDELAMNGIEHGSNTRLAVHPATELPGEMGAFAFHPDVYTRKQ
ncbi:hypothetical protein PPROV_000301400 [Pycnococcus provasolii]|uniref:Right handed beta helix domain-containing protein n=2 Tax=Pycnococcus provasolii TaxID=41880 RepID=A0A830HEN0_9CHLO|nr:hypothetical protein PPROV_000301400 [Pycnococcus provasolii]